MVSVVAVWLECGYSVVGAWLVWLQRSYSLIRALVTTWLQRGDSVVIE